MKKYVRYIVEGSKKLQEHSYSAEINHREALNYAIQCADHKSMAGKVYGLTTNGEKHLIYSNQSE